MVTFLLPEQLESPQNFILIEFKHFLSRWPSFFLLRLRRMLFGPFKAFNWNFSHSKSKKFLKNVSECLLWAINRRFFTTEHRKAFSDQFRAFYCHFLRFQEFGGINSPLLTDKNPSVDALSPFFCPQSILKPQKPSTVKFPLKIVQKWKNAT